jgi:hypothetical protein
MRGISKDWKDDITNRFSDEFQQRDFAFEFCWDVSLIIHIILSYVNLFSIDEACFNTLLKYN